MAHQGKIDSNALPSVKTSTLPRNNGLQTPCKRQRCKKNAKVKFLEAEEVINLNSGTRKPTQVIHHKLCSVTDPLDSFIAVPERPISKTTTSKCLQVTCSTSCTCTVLQQRVQLPNGVNSNFGKPSHHVTSVKSMKTTGSDNRLGKPVASSVNVKDDGKDVKSCDPEFPSNLKEKQPEGKDDGSNEEAQFGLNREGAVTNNSEIKMAILSTSQKYPANHPALENIWKGSFEVPDIAPHGRNYEGIMTHLGLNEVFTAHPPAKVSRKAYEFSKQLAGVLQFNFHPIQEQWPKTFQTDIPNGNDIGLYFYPQKFERSKKKYSTILKYIEKNDLMLKSCIGDVELLVFPSKLLAADCQKLDGSFFMWGVFHHLKKVR
ncbi:RING/FYVE/PHD zinc finger superfamily protein [Quillaja saponaria]|uniref:RING/FYVE/PHD zinc finger superfamily protein n=1 Tax=Quillaja saponaria TaxID=32244 RepID=A0AAD7LB78_QUISA|nr:RING/FYVE/PHD zinc finger superfamily protein [Quillaja saponaria]KAJ7954166.1 RING/FYVE/PHD zinc finger superfamily protein [Quillaja saponaria]